MDGFRLNFLGDEETGKRAFTTKKEYLTQLKGKISINSKPTHLPNQIRPALLTNFSSPGGDAQQAISKKSSRSSKSKAPTRRKSKRFRPERRITIPNTLRPILRILTFMLESLWIRMGCMASPPPSLFFQSEFKKRRKFFRVLHFFFMITDWTGLD